MDQLSATLVDLVSAMNRQGCGCGIYPTVYYIHTYIYIHIYAHAFRPVCCLLFLAETTFFALFRGKEEDVRKTKNAFLARFNYTFGGHFLL